MARGLVLGAVLLSICAVVGAQGNTVFVSDGGSMAGFCCHDGTQDNTPPIINYSDGQPAPSIEYHTVTGVSRDHAPYAIPTLETGQYLYGAIDFKVELDNRVPIIASYGQANWYPNPDWWRRPVPFVAYYHDAPTPPYLEVQYNDQDGNFAYLDVPYQMEIGVWQRAEVTLAPAVGGDNVFTLRIDGEIVVEMISYGVVVPGETCYLTIGAGGSDGETWVKYDNIVLEVRDEAPTYACVGFGPPMDNGPVTVKKNRALPLKANLLAADGTSISDADIVAAPVLQVLFQASGGGTPIDVSGDALPAGMGSDGNRFEYSPSDGLWHYNLKTGNYDAPGTYNLAIVTGNEGEYLINPACTAVFVTND
jgi:hypothetical protein